MALKGHRNVTRYDISRFLNEVAERGGVVCVASTAAASGAALDQGTNLVSYVANPSGLKPAGILLCDMVNIDQTRQHINFHKDEVQKGGKVTLCTLGEVSTNMIYPGVTPTVGADAYAVHSGYITSTNGGAAATPKIGRFLSAKDEDGYAKVEINLT